MNVAVSDPFDVVRDRALPTLALALDPVEVDRRFRQEIASGLRHEFELRAIRVTRYKPARRCVIEYDLDVDDGAWDRRITWLGKVHARHDGASALRLLEALRQAGFDDSSADGIVVPQPIAALPDWKLWLQAKVPGVAAGRLLLQPGATALMRRVAEAAHKLHRAGVPAQRSHTMADELAVLRDRLGRVGSTRPAWQARLAGLLAGCERLAAALPPCPPCPIHRDFYADQLIVDRDRLTLLDFDLYCAGDPGLDIGNFIGHLTELSLRTRGDAAALAHLEDALERDFVELAGEAVRRSVRTYALLTLVRHVYLSTLFAQRRLFTEALLELCEARIASYAPAQGARAACAVSAMNCQP